MATVSFDKNIIIKESDAVEKLLEVLSSKDIKPINKKLASSDAMARSEEILNVACCTRKILGNDF